MNRVFVFGTLQEGFPNFNTNSGERIPGEFITEEKLHLYLVGDRYSPWLMEKSSIMTDGTQVTGQVFEVQEDTLNKMDLLERIQEPDGYRRKTIKVRATITQVRMEVFVYLKPWDQLNQNDIKAGPLPRYTLEHAKLYRPRS